MELGLHRRMRFLLELNTLYSYILRRAVVKLRSMAFVPPLYPFEETHVFDSDTQAVLTTIQAAIPSPARGDNPGFNKNWRSIHERDDIARRISASVRNAVGALQLKADRVAVNAIRDVGYAVLETKRLSPESVNDLVRHLDGQEVYPSHVVHFATKQPAAKSKIRQRKEPFGSYDVGTILRAPLTVEILADGEIIATIAEYFGCLPTIASVNVFWAFVADDGKPRGSQRFHRDVDDAKTCTLFINLTDTQTDDGAHCYIAKTHDYANLTSVFRDEQNDTLPSGLSPLAQRLRPDDFFNLPLNGYGSDKLYAHFFQPHMRFLYGERGSVIVTDNYGIHRGIPPLRRDRLIMWVSYALTSTHTQAASVKHQKRVPYSAVASRVQNGPMERYVLRNMIDFRC